MKFQSNKIKWGMSQKSDGSMKLELSDLDVQNMQNRKIFFNKLGIDINNIISANQIHKNNVVVVTKKNKGQIITGTGGLITNKKNLFLTVTIADCVPIYFFDEKKIIIGLAHADWRGVVKNISKLLIDKMINKFNSRPEDIIAYIGPHLQKCHFEVKEDVLSQFKSEYVIKENNLITVDLLSMIKKQLLSQGIMADNISSSSECTYCDEDKYFSYRRDKPEKIKAMIAFIGIV